MMVDMAKDISAYEKMPRKMPKKHFSKNIVDILVQLKS
jgi:hypothetical protein